MWIQQLQFRFTSCAKEALHLITKKPAVVAFVYDKDDEKKHLLQERTFQHCPWFFMLLPLHHSAAPWEGSRIHCWVSAGISVRRSLEGFVLPERGTEANCVYQEFKSNSERHIKVYNGHHLKGVRQHQKVL